MIVSGSLDLSSLYKDKKEPIESRPTVVSQVQKACVLIAGAGIGIDFLRTRVGKSSAAKGMQVKGYGEQNDLAACRESAQIMALQSGKKVSAFYT